MSALLEDYRNTTHTLIRNWKELDNPPNPVNERLAAACTRINSFIQLMAFIPGDEIEM
jgi:hypothetical protein